MQITKSEWKPDFGPAEFVPNWGATMAGARKFLIAYNVNVLGTKEQAHRIALDIREQGRSKEEVCNMHSGYVVFNSLLKFDISSENPFLCIFSYGIKSLVISATVHMHNLLKYLCVL